MKCLFVSLHDEEDDGDEEYIYDKTFTTKASLISFKSKKNLLNYLQKNISYSKGSKVVDFKSIKKYLDEWGHCMWVFPYKDLQWAISNFRLTKININIKETA